MKRLYYSVVVVVVVFAWGMTQTKIRHNTSFLLHVLSYIFGMNSLLPSRQPSFDMTGKLRMRRQMALLFCAVDNIILSFSFMPYSLSSSLSPFECLVLSSVLLLLALFSKPSSTHKQLQFQHLYPLIWTLGFNSIQLYPRMIVMVSLLSLLTIHVLRVLIGSLVCPFDWPLKPLSFSRVYSTILPYSSPCFSNHTSLHKS